MKLSELLEQAILIAHDVAIGDTEITTLVVAVPQGGPPMPVIVEADDEASREVAVREALKVLGSFAGRWVSVVACTRADMVLCTASTDEGVASACLLVDRDDAGVVMSLSRVGDFAVANEVLAARN